jgi:cytochrome c553
MKKKTQLEIGTDVEMEHKMGRKVAKKIAKQHIAEFANYYPALLKMEAGLKKKNKKVKK